MMSCNSFWLANNYFIIQAEIFTQNGNAYWTILVEYESMLEPVEKQKTKLI
jgi:hypothetical protein